METIFEDLKNLVKNFSEQAESLLKKEKEKNKKECKHDVLVYNRTESGINRKLRNCNPIVCRDCGEEHVEIIQQNNKTYKRIQ